LFFFVSWLRYLTRTLRNGSMLVHVSSGPFNNFNIALENAEIN